MRDKIATGMLLGAMGGFGFTLKIRLYQADIQGKIIR